VSFVLSNYDSLSQDLILACRKLEEDLVIL
jgi:hypothetical protein